MSARKVTPSGSHPHGYPVKLNDSAGHARLAGGRGRGWQTGQLYADRFMNGSRRTGVPHRGHGSPSRPYTASDRLKYPLSPLTFTYRLSNEVPPAASASARTSRTAASSLAAPARRMLEVALAQCVLARHSASSA